MNTTNTRTITILAVVCLVTLAFAQAKKPPAFYCKYCGKQVSSIASLTASKCIRHPAGPHKGNHEPAL